MYKIKTYNHIDDAGISLFPEDRYQISDSFDQPDAILLRSYVLHDQKLPESVLAIARAGAGINNLPIDKLSKLGIPVFNTPGANANAVKELTIAAMLIAARHLLEASRFTKQLANGSGDLKKTIETLKKQFVGHELRGKKLAVVGLGAIGGLVANTAESLGMHVIGYDPNITVDSAWRLSAPIEHAKTLTEAIQHADYVSLHIPLIEETTGLFNEETLRNLKDNSVLLNFSRGEIVDETALVQALKQKTIRGYLTDFPTQALIKQENAWCFPHLGASTLEAEQNCAARAARELMTFLETGEIGYCVNFPSIKHPLPNHLKRLTIVHQNIPNMISKISSSLADKHVNIVDMQSRSRDDVAYTIMDINEHAPANLADELASIEQVIRVRAI